ncbi:MAG TPA: WYL domain-containing protein [Microthrixaceae bacterium]|nr:WYL domain-containing protein [Microthrixaceae bacterium]
MRADRLVAILLMLQRRDLVTAAQVAEELEISVRTARRDLEALSMAGVPVYSQQGRGGGWRLLGGGKLDLSGLNADEARSLFTLVGPRADVTPEVRSALRKLVRALPEPLRHGAEAAAAAVVIDPTGWDYATVGPRRPDMLDALESAVIDGECVRLGYRARSGEVTERVVHPLGLAAKGRNWYLVTNTDAGFRTFRVDRVSSAERTGEPVLRPDGFELTDAWARIVEGIDQLRTPAVATGTARPDAVKYLRVVFGRRVDIDGTGETGTGESRATETDESNTGESSSAGGATGGDRAPHVGTGDDRRVRFTVRGSNVRALANDLAGLGNWVIIDSPNEIRDLLGQIGEELVGLYT